MTSQLSFPVTLPSGAQAPGVVLMSLDGSGVPQAISPSNSLPVAGGGGGGGGIPTYMGYVWTDATGQFFELRSNGGTPPTYTAFTMPGGTPYTVGPNPRPYPVSMQLAGVDVSPLNSVPVALQSGTATIGTTLLTTTQVNSLTSNAATAALQSTQITALASLALASLQSTEIVLLSTVATVLATAQFGGMTTTQISALATTALQSTEIGLLTARMPTLGPAAIASSTPVVTPLPATIFSGQVKIAVTGTAVQFGSNVVSNGVAITANSGNAASIYIGPTGVTNTGGGTGNGYTLVPGQSTAYACSNTNDIYINGTAGDWISFTGN